MSRGDAVRLTSLHVDRLPGLDQPLHLDALTAGVNVIVGPNASGKSSLVRALMAVLYPSEHEGVLDVRAEFGSAGGEVLRAHRIGQDVAWERDGRSDPAPALPPYHLVGAYSIRLEDLLAAERAAQAKPRGRGRSQTRDQELTAIGDVDRAIATVIGTALSGGIDLGAVRRGIGTQSEAGLKLARALREAAAERGRLTAARAALREREDKLPGQEDDLKAAREHASRSQAVASARELLEAGRELAAANAELSQYPPGLEDLRGGEYDTLVELDEQIDSDTRSADEVARDISELRGVLAGVGFDPQLTRASVDPQVKMAARLVSDAEELARKSVELAALKARRREVERRLGGVPTGSSVSGGVIDDELLERVESLVEARQAAASDLDALERQRSRLEADQPAGPDADVPTEQLSRLRLDLLRWLALPHDALRRPAWAWGVALALTLATVIATVMATVTANVAANVTATVAAPVATPVAATAPDLDMTLPLVLAGCAVLWLIVMWIVVRTPADASRRPLEAEVLRTLANLHTGLDRGVTDELTWDHRSVADRVAAIDRVLAEHARTRSEHERRADALRSVEVDIEAAGVRRDRTQKLLDELRGTHGFTLAPDVRLSSWLQAIRDLTSVSADLAALHAAGSQVHDRVTKGTADLKRFLVESTDATAEEVEALDHLHLGSRLEDLARRVSQRDSDAARLAGLEREQERATASLRRLATERSQLLAVAMVADGDDAARELRRRMELLPARRESSDRLRKAEAAVKHLERLLEHEDAGLLELAAIGDDSELDHLSAECEAAATRAEALEASIRQTRDDIERAASDRSIERATARLAAATEDLTAHRAEALRLGAARFLLERVEAEHRAEARPPELERAAALFERFTRGAFTLHVDETAPTQAALAAADANGRRLTLDQLSSGTRAQLLIASRLAFALEAEARDGSRARAASGAPPLGLPFVLDEALTTSDPERFAAVAAALLDVAAFEGRQVIYLSARQDDADLWRQAAAAHGSSIGVVQLGSHGVGSAASPAAS